MSPFDFVNSINQNKRDLLAEDPLSEKEYKPFLVNRSLSYFPDTIMYANAMNMIANGTEKKWQYDFLRIAVPKRQRFAKWAKRTDSNAVTAVQMFYKYSEEKAMEVASILSDEQIAFIKQQMDRGGTS